MPINRQHFHLSPQGTLRLAIASLLLLPPLALANGITGVDGPGGTPQLHDQGGVPIVNIVAPNTAGLSHNQFLDYNVDRQGVVLNNALQAGQSQLAGQLASNPQFHGQAASVILNEVIGRNASALNGAQEIFGRKADYVLANPNGISVNGARFINAPSASLVVGRPELDNGKLHAFNTADAHGQLSVQQQGLDNPGGAIGLIAPQIDSQGQISARDSLTLVVGRNQVDAASGAVNTVYPGGTTKDGRIDASLFGAMKAGRINIISTAEGAGVRIGAVPVAGTDGVSIRSAGDLEISGQTHANSLEATRAGVNSSKGDVDLHGARDVTLAGADISGGNVKLDAGRNLTLSSLESTALQEKREQWNNKALFVTYETYDRTTTDQDSRQHGTQITARQNAALSSGADTLIKGSHVEAGDTLGINSGKDLRLVAATETHDTRDQGNHRKHLWKESWDTSTHDERTVASSLKAGKSIELASGQKLQLQGAELKTPGDIQLSAREVEIASASRSQNHTGTRYSGDLLGGSFFGSQGEGDGDKTLHTGSQVNAGGKLIVKADDGDVSIKGSDLAATGGDVNLKGKSIELLAAHDSSDSKTRDVTTDGGIAWTASLDKVGSGLEFSRQDSKDNANRTTAKTSNVTATGNVQVQADNTLVNEGSRIVAGSGLQVNAARVDNRAAHNTESSSHTETGWQAGLGVSAEISGLSNPLEKVVKGLVKGTMPQSALMDGVELASVGLDGQVGYHNKTQAQQDSTAVVCQLSGATVQVYVGGKLQDEGTQYRATDGALNIQAGSHDASAAVDTHSRSEQGVAAKVGVRVYTKTGEDVNVRANGSGEFNRAQESTSTAQVGRYAGAKGVSIDTQGDARYEGGDFDGGAGSVNLNAGGKLALEQVTDTRSQSAMGLSASGSLAVEAGKGINLSPGGVKFDYQPDNSPASEAHIAMFRGQERLRLSGATVGGDLLKGENKERQSLQANIDQAIN